MKKRQPFAITTQILDSLQILQTYTATEAHAWRKQWRKAYAENTSASMSQYLWHVFSAQDYPASEADAAITEYEQHQSPEYVVLCNDVPHAVLSKNKPDADIYDDLYVFPPNLAWTMAFTHERGWLGPYFAKHRHYAALHQQNLQRLDKQRAKQHAAQQGWM